MIVWRTQKKIKPYQIPWWSLPQLSAHSRQEFHYMRSPLHCFYTCLEHLSSFSVPWLVQVEYCYLLKSVMILCFVFQQKDTETGWVLRMNKIYRIRCLSVKHHHMCLQVVFLASPQGKSKANLWVNLSSELPIQMPNKWLVIQSLWSSFLNSWPMMNHICHSLGVDIIILIINIRLCSIEIFCWDQPFSVGLVG